MESGVHEGKREVDRLQADAALLQGRLERAELEKIELVRVLERKQTEMDSLTGQVESLIRKQAQSRQELTGRDLELEETRRSLTAARVELTVVQQSADQARKQAEWNAAELDKTLQEFKEHRKQKVLTIGRPFIEL